MTDLYKVFLQKHACEECKAGTSAKPRGGKMWSKQIRPLCVKCYKSYSIYCKQDLMRRMREIVE